MKIQQLIAKKESDVLEFKASFGKDVIETICAFANHRGGKVMIGVADDGKIVGTSCSAESIQKWANEIKQVTTPSIVPEIEVIPIERKKVVVIHVDEFPIKPVACRDRYFKRIANSNHRLSLTEIANLDEIVKSQFLPLRHKGTKKCLLKTFRFFFVSPVIFV